MIKLTINKLTYLLSSTLQLEWQHDICFLDKKEYLRVGKYDATLTANQIGKSIRMCVHQIMFKEPTTTQFKNILMLTLSSMCCQFFVFGTYQEINVTSMLCLSLHTGVGHSTHDTPLRVWNPYSTFQFSNR